MKVKFIILIILLLIFTIFVIQNTAMVELSFLTFDLTMPRAFLLAVTFAIGLLVGIFLPYEFRKQRKKTD